MLRQNKPAGRRIALAALALSGLGVLAAGLAAANLAGADDGVFIPRADVFHSSMVDFNNGAEDAAPPSGDTGAPPAACQLVYLSSTRKLQSCSGVLVTPTTVLTAAHCLADAGIGAGRGLSVNCGITGQLDSGRMSFLESFTARRARYDTSFRNFIGQDFALVRLDHPSNLPPLSFPASVEKFTSEFLVQSPLIYGQLELASTVDCRFSGFGGDDDHVPNFRTLDQSPRNGLKGYTAGSALVLNAYGEDAQKLRAGDSGGPLYCRRSPASPWRLVAVYSAQSAKNYVTSWSVVASETFLSAWHGYLINDRP